jgi:hypothetical protein
MNPEYPVYIVSKSRWKSRLTSKYLEWMKVPYYIVIEPQEYDDYSTVINSSKILVMPEGNLGFGSIPARNFAWEHSISIGAKKHWCLDDNIRGFSRINHNESNFVSSGTPFRVAEIFVDRYENIGLACFSHKFSGGGVRRKKPPIKLNTACYSCILIKNDLPLRWRGKYNEDSDISIRVLKLGFCTVTFNAFVVNKPETLTMKGGNTTEIHAGDGLLKRAQYLAAEFPDIARVEWKWNRWQHSVSYKSFKNNKLIKKEGLSIPKGINNYGMVFKECDVPLITKNLK